MYRVVALGHWAAGVVDRLRTIGNFDDIRFVYYDTDTECLMSHGNNNDEYILLTSLEQCREAIRNDCEFMTVLVTDLGDRATLKYVANIVYELWGYADYTYCFATAPKLGNTTVIKEEYAKLFRWITDHSLITVLQDRSRLPENLDSYNGIALLLGLVLHHPRKGTSDKRNELPLGVLATEKQLYMAFQAMYSNNPEMQGYYDAATFSFHKSTHEY